MFIANPDYVYMLLMFNTYFLHYHATPAPVSSCFNISFHLNSFHIGIEFLQVRQMGTGITTLTTMIIN